METANIYLDSSVMMIVPIQQSPQQPTLTPKPQTTGNVLNVMLHAKVVILKETAQPVFQVYT